MHNKVFFKFIILICVVSLPGCATMQIKDLFSGYAQQMEPIQQQLKNGQVEQANHSLEMRSPTDTSYILSLLEKGRIAQLAGHYQQSLTLFITAINYVENSQLQAKIQLSHGLQNISAVITNDNAITYQMADHEKSMLHSYQA